MKLNLDYVKLLWQLKPWIRVSLLVFFLVPIPTSLLAISFFYRLPHIKQAEEEIRRPLRLKMEIDEMMAAGNEKDLEIIKARWEEIRNKVPGSYEDVSYFIENFVKFISSRGFSINYMLGELKPAYQEMVGFSILPIKANLMIKRINVNQTADKTMDAPVGLVEYIELLHEIVSNYFGVDLVGIRVIGTGSEIRTIHVSFNLWVGFGGEAVYQQKDVGTGRLAL